MEARTRSFAGFILLIMVISLPILGPVNGDVESPTLISGKITDSETGEPVEGAFVAVVNLSKDLHFYYLTEEDGSYSINVGTSGTFRVYVFTETHHEKFEEVALGLFDVVEVNMEIERYDHNVRVHFYSWDEEYPLFALEVGITDSNGNETIYLTDDDGWLRLKLDDGNYTIRSYRDFLEPYEKNFTISEDEVLHDTAILRPVNVNGTASRIIYHNNIYIPPKVFRAVVIDDEEPTQLWLTLRSDVIVTVYQMTQYMFDKYLEKHTGIPYPHEEAPSMEYDVRFTARGGGGSVTMWKIPYYIVIANNGTESALVSVDLRYEYGSPIVSDVIGGTLEPRSLETDQEGFSLSSIYLVSAFFLFLVVFTVTFNNHRK